MKLCFVLCQTGFSVSMWFSHCKISEQRICQFLPNSKTINIHRKCVICSIYMKFGKVRNKRAVSVTEIQSAVELVLLLDARAQAQSTQQKK